MDWLVKVQHYLAQSWQSVIQDLKVLRETPIPAQELNRVLQQISLPNLNFYLLLALATIIATLGLLMNSAATIIGAMIIAPLMNPIVTLAYSFAICDFQLFKRAIFTLFTGVCFVIAIAYLTTKLLGLMIVGSEILGRTTPSSLDLGVALAAGAAAAFANTRRSIANALPGVAIAVALVPPLSVVGIGLYLGELGTAIAQTRGVETNIAGGSFLLFFTNLIGIIFGGSLMFLSQQYGLPKKAMLSLMGGLIGLLLLLQPLGFSLKQIYVKSIAMRTILELRQKQPDLFPGSAEFLSVKSSYRQDGQLHLYLQIEVQMKDIDNVPEKVDLIAQEVSKTLKQPVKIYLDIVPIQRFESNS